MILSEEQQHILDRVASGSNVIVDAVAGTGKTTLILAIAQALPDKQLLQMTYNKSLKFEVREKVDELHIENLRIHTYHSLAVCYYASNAYVDTELKKIIDKDMPPSSHIPSFDLLILDETQDMTPLYYKFMVKFARDAGYPIQLLVLGDYMQGLYEFKGSDTRFLTMATEIWEPHPILRTRDFEKCTMKMSYRITNQMRNFVNNVMIGDDRMNSCRDDNPVHYIRNSSYNIERIVCAEINKLFEQGAKPSDIFILGPSVKGGRSNIRKLENMLVEKNIPCHVPMLENTDIDQRIVDGKVVFSTFHCVKGRQRKYVFVVGFDNSYFRCYARTIPRDSCPNTLYVACTRATKGLYVLESDTRREDRPLEFLHMDHIQMKQENYIHFRGNQQSRFIRLEEVSSPYKTTPTDLIKFIPDDISEKIGVILDRIFVVETEADEPIDIPSVIQTKEGFYEEVSDLNGIAIPCIYYDHLINAWSDFGSNKTKDSVLYDIIDMNMENINDKNQSFLMEMIEKLPDTITSVSEYLYLANLNLAIQESLYFKLKQIGLDEYTWLSDEDAMECKDRLRSVVSPDCLNTKPQIEEYIAIASSDEQHMEIDRFVSSILPGKQFRFTARVDLITETTVWEFKCTSELSFEHKLQLVIYAWLWKMCGHTEEKSFHLFNIKTNELQKLVATEAELNEIMEHILVSRYTEPIVRSDDEFIEGCLEYIESSCA